VFVLEDLYVQVDQLQVRLRGRVVVTPVVGEVRLLKKSYKLLYFQSLCETDFMKKNKELLSLLGS